MKILISLKKEDRSLESSFGTLQKLRAREKILKSKAILSPSIMVGAIKKY